jgi:hypothetical protein
MTRPYKVRLDGAILVAGNSSRRPTTTRAALCGHDGCDNGSGIGWDGMEGMEWHMEFKWG